MSRACPQAAADLILFLKVMAEAFEQSMEKGASAPACTFEKRLEKILKKDLLF